MVKTQSKSEIAPPLPANFEAERAILGAVLLDNLAIDEAAFLKDADFYSGQHRVIYQAMTEMTENSEPIDLVTLTDKLAGAGKLKEAGGADYIAKLADGMPKVSNVANYAKLVKQKSMLRRTIEISDLAQRVAFMNEASAETIVDQALQSFLNLALDNLGAELIGKTSKQAAISLFHSLENNSVLRVNTGIEELDKLTGGFRAGELITITAGTGVGKTFFAQQIKRKACAEGLHGLYFSGEMSAEQLMSRELATEAGVEHWKMRRPERLTSEDRTALLNAAAQECTVCTTVDGELNVRNIRIAARRKKRATDLKWIVIDYDELVEAPGKDDFAQLRVVVREAKSLAVLLQIPVFMISQLRKPLDAKEAKKPTLERLYGSGAKSKHSSFVIFVDREYVRELKGDETKARICMLKARDGQIGMIPATFDLSTLRFRTETDEEAYLRAKKKGKKGSEPQEEEG